MTDTAQAADTPDFGTLTNSERIIFDDLSFIYGPAVAQKIMGDVQKRVSALTKMNRSEHLDEQDAVLITYGDICTPDDATPLAGLYQFLHNFVGDAINTIHILPCYPYSSDDGFSVIDYTKIDPALGSWEDIEFLGTEYRLMFDMVANHISRESLWFRKYLEGASPYDSFFIEVEPNTDLSSVFRPRALPLLTEFETSRGKRLVWTTFSEDQVDLNYANPEVLLRMLDVLVLYVRKGAQFIRLDAIAFIWKELGTSCIHHPKTHRIIKLFRHILDAAHTGVHLITETNVPHRENISYFGNGHDEASMVYNFPLPPLTLHAFMRGDATVLSTWAGRLEFPSEEVTYFNFLASHDGIGLLPVHGILPESEIEAMAEGVVQLGGYVSRKNNHDGTTSPYELNINFLDALAIADLTGKDSDMSRVIDRFIASQSIMLALRGVPGIYVHSLIGSRNWDIGPQITGMARSINRKKLRYEELSKELEDPKSLAHRVLDRYRQLLRARKRTPAFHPAAEQTVLRSPDPALFILKRTSENDSECVLCITNVSGRYSSELQLSRLLLDNRLRCSGSELVDLITGSRYSLQGENTAMQIAPYEVLWLYGGVHEILNGIDT